MTFYWKVRKDFLDCIEDSMSHDSLIGSTISTRYKKSGSCASKISSPSVLSNDTKTSKVSEKDNPHDFYPKNLNHAYLPKTDFDGYRNNAKKEVEENKNHIGEIGEEFHQEPDHPSTFMKMVKEITKTISAVNYDIRSWCQLLQQYETDGNRNVRIKRLESVINTVFHRNYRGGLVKWIQHYEDAFT
jgi:hypothetical protein